MIVVTGATGARHFAERGVRVRPADGPVSWTDRADAAEAAAVVLAGDRAFDGPVTLTARRAVTSDDVAAMASEISGRARTPERRRPARGGRATPAPGALRLLDGVQEGGAEDGGAVPVAGAEVVQGAVAQVGGVSAGHRPDVGQEQVAAWA